jgi:hypothetical protein
MQFNQLFKIFAAAPNGAATFRTIDLSGQKYLSSIQNWHQRQFGFIQNQNSMLRGMYMIKDGQGFHHKQPKFFGIMNRALLVY